MFNMDDEYYGQSTKTRSQEDYGFFIDGTKQIMENIEATREQLSTLEQDATKIKHVSKNFQTLIKTFKESLNENVTFLENQTNLTEFIKQYYTKFFSMSQTIYTSILELTDVTTIEHTTLHQLSDEVNENEEKFKLKMIQYINTEKKIKETYQVSSETEERKQALIEEKEVVQLELDKLTEEISTIEESVKLEISSIQKLKQVENEIDILKKESIKWDEDMLTLTTSQKHIIEEKQREYELIAENITATDQKIKDIEEELKQTLVVLETSLTEKRDVETYLLCVKNDIKNEEDKYTKVVNRFEEITKNIVDAEERFTKDELFYVDLRKGGTYLQSYIEGNDKMTNEIETRKLDIAALDSELEILELSITDIEGRPNLDLEKQLETKQEKLQQKELSYQNLKEDYQLQVTKKKAEIQAEISDFQEGNEKIEESNQNLQTAIKNIDNKINQKQEEKIKCEKDLLDLQQQPKGLNSKSEVPVKQVRRWDSDSTIDGEERAEDVIARIRRIKK